MAEPQISIAEDDETIRRCFPVLRQLRPQIGDAEDLLRRVRRMRVEGYRLAYLEEAAEIAACAGFRITERLAWGRMLYLDDLITREDLRGRGFAARLLRWLEDVARAEGCGEFHLDSGVQRLAAHRVYHAHHMAITSFHFAKPVGKS